MFTAGAVKNIDGWVAQISTMIGGYSTIVWQSTEATPVQLKETVDGEEYDEGHSMAIKEANAEIVRVIKAFFV